MNVVIFIVSIFLAYAIDTILVGIAFQALSNRFGWRISYRKSLGSLFLVFAFIDCYLWPAFIIADVTYTVRNEALARFLNLGPDEALIDLFEPGTFEFFVWSIETLIARYLGEKIIRNTGNAI